MNLKILLLFSFSFFAHMISSGQTSISKYDTLTFYSIQKQYEAELLITTDANYNHVEKEDIIGRWQWFWRDRVDKNGGFNQYFKEMDESSTRHNSRLKSTSGINWTSLGPINDPQNGY